MPALLTPLTKEGKLNKVCLEKLIEDLIAQGAYGFYIGGATGQGIILDKDVLEDLITESVKIVKGRVPIIAHIARMNYNEMLEIAKFSEKAGVDAVSAIPPIFYKYSFDDIYRYYEGLSDVINIPIMIYNNPNTGTVFAPEQIAELYKIKNVKAVKWTNYNFYSVMVISALTEGKFNVISGPDEMLLLGLTAGCDGGIGTTYNFLMPEIKEIYERFKAGDIDGAREMQKKVDLYINELLRYGETIQATRVVMAEKGYDILDTVYPKADLKPELKEQLISNLKKLGYKF